MSLLSDRQREDLHKAILDYLHANNYMSAFHSLRADTGCDYTPDPSSQSRAILEKKWTTILDLESRNAALQDDLSTAPAKRANHTDWLPRNPPAHTLTSHRAPITQVAFHPQYSVLASASEDATVKIWDWETGEFERTLKGHTKSVNDLNFDHKGHLLVTCSSDLFIKIWDSQSEYKNTKTFPGHEHSVSSVRFMPGDQHIISASRDKTIRLFDVPSTHQIRTISGHSEWVRCVTPSSDGKIIASCSKDQTIRIWDPLTGEQKLEFRGHDNDIEVVAFAPLSTYTAISHLTGIPITERSKRHGRYLASGSRDKSIKLWDTLTGQLLTSLSGHDNWVRALAFHPSGKYLLSSADDKTIRVWELSTGRCIKTVDAHTHFVSTLVWGRQAASTISGDTKPNGSIHDSSAEPEKLVNVIASGSVDQTIKIWLP
ncbi:Lissencephaly-1 [Leucoagaricus gongylophorus]